MRASNYFSLFPGLIIVTITLMSAGCSYRKEKIAPGQGGAGGKHQGTSELRAISYEDVRAAIIGPKCLSCHSQAGRVNLAGYQAVKGRLRDIERVAIHEMTMPPGRPLTPDERDLLAEWIEAGAPEKVVTNTPTNPTPTPDPIPTPTKPPVLEANFASLKTIIFEKKCVSCHYAGGPIKDILFDKEEDLLNSPRDLVLPGDAEESGLYIAVSRTDRKRMPPPSSGQPPLSQEEIETVKKWISDIKPE